MTTIRLPMMGLVVLIGTTGSGKSTFAATHFGPFETVSSDYCRGLVADDVNDQSASTAAFDLLHHIVGVRLARGRFTVVDATNLTRSARASLIALAKEHDVLPSALVLDVPTQVAIQRHQARTDRPFGVDVIRRQRAQVPRGVGALRKEGFRNVYLLDSEQEIADVEIVRTPLLNDRRDLHGPFDAIGDVHGCLSELLTLLDRLGYRIIRDDAGRAVDAEHPDGRTAIFLGDLVDRGPDSPGVLRLAMGMTRAGHAIAIPGNHEQKLIRALDGTNVSLRHGLELTLSQLARESEEFRDDAREWCRELVAHLVLDDGNLVVAHAGLKEAYHGRASGRVRAFSLYGDTTGESDEYGLPVRLPWAEDYRGRAVVLYGHTPTPTLDWVNNTLCLDTGCVFGGHLSALRYPERETVQVPAERVWYEPVKPLAPAPEASPARRDGQLDLEDVLGAHSIETSTIPRVSVRPEQAAGALEVMSRFALPPGKLAYLPPTMSPVPASTREGFLEHPDQAWSAYAAAGVREIVCQEKHMGSRAVVHVRRDGEEGAAYTRTGRAFFDESTTAAFLDRLAAAVTAAGVFDELETDWLILDAELLPWSLKAVGLLQEQFAAVGAAARAGLAAAGGALDLAAARGLDVGRLRESTARRAEDAAAFSAAYRRYVWPVSGLDGVQLAPFQILAGAGGTYEERPHAWHLALIDRIVAADPGVLRPTRRLFVDVDDEASRAAGTQWWLDLVGDGGEGMVVKPAANLSWDAKRRLVQPGMKVRGPDYLRLVYGPEYLSHLDRLHDRNLTHKRSLATREYALGLESLRRFVAGEPLWRIHEAVFAVLALESEPVDPRL